CTAIAYDPNPPTDDSKVRSLKEYLIKFSVMNGKKPLTLDFKTFTESTGLDYAKGTYDTRRENCFSCGLDNSVYICCSGYRWELILYWASEFNSPALCLLSPHMDKMLLGPDYTQDESFGSSPTILSNSNFSKDPSKVTPIKLTDFMVVVNNREHSVNTLPFTIKKKKGKSQSVTPTLPQSQGLEASGPLPQKRKKPKSKKTPTETKVTPSKPTKDSEQSHSVSSGTVPDPKDLVRNIQLTGTRLPSTLDEGTRKSQTLPKGKKYDPKDLVGNIQPIDTGLHSTVSDEGAAKTMLLSEGPRINAKYQANQTQTARLRYRSLTKNKGKTSYEAEPDTQTLQLNTFADVQPFLLSEDEMAQESDDDVLEAEEDMEEDTQTDEEEHQSPPPNTDKPEPSLA
ncbi:hypothetical protein Tco_1151060, partial [Tanacetum coccineum]